MKVYVAERGVYSDRWIEGVYLTPEDAISANPGGSWEVTEYGGLRRWMNDMDWDSAASIEEFEVKGAPVLAQVLGIASVDVLDDMYGAWEDVLGPEAAEQVRRQGWCYVERTAASVRLIGPEITEAKG